MNGMAEIISDFWECYWIIVSATKMNQYLYSLIHGINLHALLILSFMSK